MIAIPLQYKVGAYVLAALAVLWLGRQWLNQHDNKVAQETRQEVTETQRVEKEAAIKAEREAVALEIQTLNGRIAELETQNTKLYGSLNNAIQLSKKMQERNANFVLGIPDDQINGAIRTILKGGQLPLEPR